MIRLRLDTDITASLRQVIVDYRRPGNNIFFTYGVDYFQPGLKTRFYNLLMDGTDTSIDSIIINKRLPQIICYGNYSVEISFNGGNPSDVFIPLEIGYSHLNLDS